jgi:CheY-like chemotaxis protein
VREQASLRVVYISGYSESLPCAEADAANDFLPKPFTPDALVRKVRQALDR